MNKQQYEIWLVVKKLLKQIIIHKDSIELLGVVTAVIISGLALYSSNEANKLTAASVAQNQKSLELQSQEFRLRNRPYLTIGTEQPMVTGPIRTADGTEYPRGLLIRVVNLSEIPALNVSVVSHVRIDGKVFSVESTAPDSLTEKGTLAIHHGNDFGFKVSVPDQLYEVLDGTNNCKVNVDMEISYFGMLKEDRPYKTTVRLDYWPPGRSFGLSRQEIE